MTTVYLIRHAQPDLSYHDDMTRKLGIVKGFRGNDLSPVISECDTGKFRNLCGKFISHFSGVIDIVEPLCHRVIF